MGAFVMPNNSINPDTPLTAFSVPLESLESASGASSVSMCVHFVTLCIIQ